MPHCSPERAEALVADLAATLPEGIEVVTATKKNVTVYESCKLASQWDAAYPDENVAYYKAKLEELYDQFRIYLPHPEPPVQGVLDLGCVCTSRPTERVAASKSLQKTRPL